jgi:hypothetical protein
MSRVREQILDACSTIRVWWTSMSAVVYSGSRLPPTATVVPVGR